MGATWGCLGVLFSSILSSNEPDFAKASTGRLELDDGEEELEDEELLELEDEELELLEGDSNFRLVPLFLFFSALSFCKVQA